MTTKSLLGLALAFAIGFACRAFDIPSPAPPVILGALLVVAMTIGYLVVDRAMSVPARHAADCGGPSGLSPSAIPAALGTPDGISPWHRWSDRAADAVRPISRIPAIRFCALLALCSSYLQGGLQKLLDFNGAIAEVQHFGLPLPATMAAATIVTELTASALVLTGVQRWLGALWLAAFTLIATFVANRFWEVAQPDRFMVENAFFEHLGLVGAFVLVALYDLRQTQSGSRHSAS